MSDDDAVGLGDKKQHCRGHEARRHIDREQPDAVETAVEKLFNAQDHHYGGDDGQKHIQSGYNLAAEVFVLQSR